MDRAKIDDRLLAAKAQHNTMLAAVRQKQANIKEQLMVVEENITELKLAEARGFKDKRINHVVESFLKKFGPKMQGNWQQEHTKYASLQNVQKRIEELKQEKNRMQAELKEARAQIKTINKENTTYITGLKLEKRLEQQLEQQLKRYSDSGQAGKVAELKQDQEKITTLNNTIGTKIAAHSKVIAAESLVAEAKKVTLAINKKKTSIILSSLAAIRDIALSYSKEHKQILNHEPIGIRVSSAIANRNENLLSFLQQKQEELSRATSFTYEGKGADVILQEREGALKEAQGHAQSVSDPSVGLKELVKKYNTYSKYRTLANGFAAKVVRRAKEMQQFTTGWRKTTGKLSGSGQKMHNKTGDVGSKRPSLPDEVAKQKNRGPRL